MHPAFCATLAPNNPSVRGRPASSFANVARQRASAPGAASERRSAMGSRDGASREKAHALRWNGRSELSAHTCPPSLWQLQLYDAAPGGYPHARGFE